jgi:hypothetical protein
MRHYDLGSIDPRQYEALTDAERQAWLHTEAHSYHSFHVERMGADTYRWRDSRDAYFYVGTREELFADLERLLLRKLDPKWQEAIQTATVLQVLSQEEVDELFKDL